MAHRLAGRMKRICSVRVKPHGEGRDMLQVHQLEKVAGGKSQLRVESFEVAAGEIVAVVGSLNSGKSLLIQLLCGQLQPSRGTIHWQGKPLHHAAKEGRIGVLFEEDLLYERLTVRQNLTFLCDLYGVPHTRADESLARVGLNDHHSAPVATLLPPVKRRLAFARVLLRPAGIWFLDQPSLRTDTETRTLVARLITEAVTAGGAVVLTEEDLTWAGRFCSRVVELEEGQLTEAALSSHSESATTPHHHTPYKVSARKEDRIVLYDPGEVLYITSHEGKTILHMAEEQATTPLTLQELEERLMGRGFFRAHRAYLVNLQHIKAVIQFTRNSYTLLLNDRAESQIPLSKNAERELQARLGY